MNHSSETGQTPLRPIQPTLRDLARHPTTSHTLQDLAYILTTAMQVTSAYICDWNPQTGNCTVLAEYISEQASSSEQISDLQQTYNFKDLGITAESWLQTGSIIVEHHRQHQNQINTRHHLEQFGGQSVLGIPLKINQQVVGFAEIWESRAHREFTEADIQLCQTITQQVGLALENIALYETQQQQLRLAQIAQKMGALLTTDLPLEQVYEHIFLLMREVIPYDGASIQLLTPEGILYPVAVAGILDLEQMRHLAHLFQYDFIQKRWQDHPAAAIPDTLNDPRWIMIPELNTIRSWVGAALTVKDTFVGMLDLCTVQPHNYSQADAQLLLTFANQAAIAIENSRLFTATQRQAQELTALHEIALSTSQIMNLSDLLSLVREQVQLLFNPFGFYVALYDEEADVIVFHEFRDDGEFLADVPSTKQFPVEGLTGWIIRHGESLLINDLLDESVPLPTKPIVSGSPTRSWLGVPILIREQVLGVISIQSYQPHAYGQTEQRFLHSLANQLAINIENVRLFAAEARRRHEAELLGQLAASLTSSLDMDTLWQKAVDLVAQEIKDIHNVSITVLDETRQFLQPRATWYAKPDYLLTPLGDSIRLSDTVATRQVIDSRSPVIIEDVQKIVVETSHSQTVQSTGIRSILYLPLLVHDTAVGVLHINVWHKQRKFRPEEIAFCQGVAYQAANAYEITRLFAAEHRQLHLARTLQQVGSLLTTHLTLEQVYEQLFELLRQVVNFDAAAIFLLDDSGQMNQVASYGAWPNETPPNEAIPFSAHLPKVWQQQPFMVAAEWDQIPAWQPTIPKQMHSWIGSAMRVKGEFVGTLNLYSWEKNRYTPSDGGLVASFANQAAIAIINTRLHEETKQGANELTVLYQVSQLIVSITDKDDLLSRTTEFLANTIYPHIFGFLLLDEEQQLLYLHSSGHGLPDNFRRTPLPMTGSVVGHVARTGNWYIVDDITQDPYYLPRFSNTQSEIAVPLKVSGKIIGVINVESPERGAFNERDVRFLTTLAGQVAAAIERIQIHQHLADMVAERTLALQAEQDRLEAILDGAGEGIFFTDPTGKLLYSNQAAQNLVNLDSSQLLGQYLFDLPNQVLAPTVYDSLRAAISRGKRWSGEMVLLAPNQRQFDIRLTLSPLYDTDYGLTGFVGIQSDISRLREVERLKSEFVANVSHELRTPLTNIITSTTLLEQGKVEKRGHYLQVLKLETSRLTRLVNSLLDLSWLETSENAPYLQPVNLRQLLLTILSGLQYSAQNRQIRLTHQLSNSLPTVPADEVQLGVALRHLLENAFAYTPIGGTIEVTADTATLHGEWLIKIMISDSGVGIPADELPRLFERFFRGRASLTLGIPGTGLGLAVARHIIEQHHGWIEIDSIEGGGTTVTLWLALTEQPIST